MFFVISFGLIGAFCALANEPANGDKSPQQSELVLLVASGQKPMQASYGKWRARAKLGDLTQVKYIVPLTDGAKKQVVYAEIPQDMIVHTNDHVLVQIRGVSFGEEHFTNGAVQLHHGACLKVIGVLSKSAPLTKYLPFIYLWDPS